MNDQNHQFHLARWLGVAIISVLLLWFGYSTTPQSAQAQRQTPSTPSQTKKVAPKKPAPRKPKPNTQPKPNNQTKPVQKTQKKPDPQKNKGNPVEGKVPPDINQRFDELMNRGRNLQKSTPKPTPTRRTPPASRRKSPTKPTVRTPDSKTSNTGKPKAAAGPTTPINIPPIESNIQPEKRMYGFSIKGGTYEQLVEGFARQTGMGVLGNAPKDGRVTFVTTEELNFHEALSRVRMLLFNYKPHEPYWIEQRDTHLAIVRVTDIYRILPPDRMFQTIELFRNANLSDEELVLVIYTPKTGSVSDLKEVRDFMPDYVRVTPLDGNRVSIFALKKDIDKYLWLIDFFAGRRSDPRSLERIKIKFISPSRAIEKLQQLIPDLGSTTVKGRPRPAPKRGSTTHSLDTMPEPEVVIIPEDLGGYLLVRAMRDKIEEIKLMLPFVDMKPSSSDRTPVIVPLQHAEVEELLSIIGEILAVTSPPEEAAKGKPIISRRRTPKTGPGEPIILDDVTLIAHPSGQAIIVLADNEEVLAHIRNLIDQFDVPIYVGPERIILQHVDASEVVTTVNAILGPTNKGKKSSDRFLVVADPNGHAVWIKSSKQIAVKIRDIIAAVDSPDDAIKLHIIQLKNQPPSFVANMLKQYDGGALGGARNKGKRAKKTDSVAKFTPDAENNLLFVLCTDSDWQNYLSLIAELEQATNQQNPFVRIELEHIDPPTAVDRISNLIGIMPGPQGPVRIVPSSGAILIVGATPLQIKDIRAYIAEVDRENDIVEYTFLLKFADPEEIKSVIETLVGSSSGGPTARRKPASKGIISTSSSTDDLTMITIGQKLVVRTTPILLERVTKIVEEFDVESGGTEIRVYEDFPPGADIAGISTTLSTFASNKSGKPASKRPTGRQQSLDPKFLPQPTAGKLIVIAEPSAFPEIERLMEVLRTEVEHDPIQVDFIAIEYANPTELVELIGPMIDMKVDHMVTAGKLSVGDKPTIAAAAVRKARSRSIGSRSSRYHMTADVRNHRIVIAAAQPIIDIAKELIAQFDMPGTGYEIVFRTVELTNTPADAMVKAIREMMGSGVRKTGTKRKAGMKAITPGEIALTVVVAPGGSAVILHGPLDEVEETTQWIHQLDEKPTGQTIKVFEIQHADITKLVELILHVIEPPSSTAVKTPRTTDRVSMDEVDFFQTSKTWSQKGIYIQADMLARTMIIATTESKMSRIEEIITRFDSKEYDDLMDDKTLPKFVYELQYVDAFDASWELESVLGQLWDPPDNVPMVESALFGNHLILKYHDESRFDDIRKIIELYVDKLSEEEVRIVKKSFAPPKGLSAKEAALWLKMNHPEFEIEVINIAEKPKDLGIQRMFPPQTHPCVLPGGFAQMTQAIALSVVGQKKKRNGGVDDMIRSALSNTKNSKKNNKSSEHKESDREVVIKKLAGEKLKVYYDSEQGVFVVEGKQAVLEQVDEWMDELKEEIKDYPVKPDIRIYRVKYIDVYSARDIIEEMFNATRQQRTVLDRARQRQQQLQRQQELVRQRQQQQQQNRGQQGGQPGRQGQRGQQNQNTNVPQLPPTSVRIFPNPRDRSLIFRADTSQYPAIEELLAIIDQPKPIDSKMHIFKLVNLNASEVEQMLNSLLGLDGKKPRTSAIPSPGSSTRRSNTRSATGQLPETIMQNVVFGNEVLGVDPQDIKITSNEEANTIMVMAPSAAIIYIEKMINELEGMDISGNEMRTLVLKFARPSKIAETIEAVLSKGSSGKDKKRSGDSRFNITPHDETKRLFVTAGDAMFTRIEKMVKTLDQPQEIGFDLKIFPLKHADARKIHEQMTSLIGDYIRKLGRDASMEPFSVEVDDNTNSLIVMGSPSVFEFMKQILSKVDTPENAASPSGVLMIALKNADAKEVSQNINRLWSQKNLSKGETPPLAEANRSLNTLIVRGTQKQLDEIKKDFIDPLEEQKPPSLITETITLQFAQPEAVAESINRIFEDKGKAITKLGRNTNINPIEFTVAITPDVNTRQIIVQASEKNMKLIKTRVAELDKEGLSTSSTVIRIYPITYADPNAVVNIINQWARSRSQSGGRARNVAPIDVVTAVAEHGTQTVVVNASESNHLIIEELITGLDDKTLVKGQRKRHVLRIQFANAQELTNQLTHVFRNTIRHRRGDPGPAFVADNKTNVIIANLTDEEFSDIQALLTKIDVEPSLESLRITEVYPLQYADPGSLNAVVLNMFRWDRRSTPSPSEQVTSSVEWATQSLIITASAKNHEIIKTLIEKTDVEPLNELNVHVITLVNADPESLSRTLQEIFVRSAGRQRRGGIPDVTISAPRGSKTIIVKCKDQLYEEIKGIITELDTEDSVIGEVVRVITLENSDASEMQRAMQEYLRKPSGSGRGKDLVGNIRLSILTQSNSVVLSGDLEKVDRLEKIIHELDSAGEGANQPQIITLTYAKVGQVLPTLQELFTQQRGGRRGKIQPVINGNDAINAIIVRAEPTDLSAIESVIRSLDTEAAADKPNFRLVQVQSGINVNDLAIKVERSVNEGARAQSSGGGRGRSSSSITVTPDQRTGSIIIAGTPTLFDEAEKLVRALEKMGPSGGRITKIIPIVNIGMDDVQKLISQLTGKSSSGNRPRRATRGRSSGNQRRGSGNSQRGGRQPSRRRGG